MRHGLDQKLDNGAHTFFNVYTEMLLQVARDFAGLPDVRTLKASEIRFFYNGLRAELREASKPRDKRGK